MHTFFDQVHNLGDRMQNNCKLMADRSFYDLSSFVFVFEFKV